LEATETLARIIASMPMSMWPLQAATTIATRLIALLPTQSTGPGQSLLASTYRANSGRILRIGLVLVSVALAVAFQMGVFTTMDPPKSGGNSVSSFAVSPG
jgi:hypothetical protein